MPSWVGGALGSLVSEWSVALHNYKQLSLFQEFQTSNKKIKPSMTSHSHHQFYDTCMYYLMMDFHMFKFDTHSNFKFIIKLKSEKVILPKTIILDNQE